jgi:hypothetical protein
VFWRADHDVKVDNAVSSIPKTNMLASNPDSGVFDQWAAGKPRVVPLRLKLAPVAN